MEKPITQVYSNLAICDAIDHVLLCASLSYISQIR